MIRFTPEDISMMIGFISILIGIYGRFKGDIITNEKRSTVIEKDIENLKEFKRSATRRLDSHDEQNKAILVLAEQVKGLSEDVRELKNIILKEN